MSEAATAEPQAIDALVQAAMLKQHLPGVSLVVARAGEVVVARGYGERNVGEHLPADPDTIYSIASISKQFTVAGIMQLAERGLLSVDDPLKRYFPWLVCDDAIELRHVLSHTSGIRDYFSLAELDRIGFSQAGPREIAEHATAGGNAFAPGAEYQYCNTGYVLLGAILERVAGMTYAQYLTTHVFEPLEMTRSGVDDTPAIRGNTAVGYTSFALGPWEIARDYHPSWEFATGGLYSTVVDMLKWNLALRAGRVVGAASLARMTTRAILSGGDPVNYGFGLALGDVGGMREIRHTGGLPGMSTDNTTYPDAAIDIIVFVNHDNCSVYATIVRPILELLLDEPGREGMRTSAAAAIPSSLAERPETHAWIRAALAGEIERLPLTAKFKRFLRPDRRASLAALHQCGDVNAIRFIEANRRDPETAFTYAVGLDAIQLAVALTVRDDGDLAGLVVNRWDERG